MTEASDSQVFISYSHADAVWLQRLQIHLRPLSREYGIDVWDDTRIKPGMEWKQEISNAVASAKVAVLLVSADFLASDFIATNELPPLLKTANERGTKILPVIVSPCRFRTFEGLSKFQAVNDPSQPLIALSRGEQEDFFVKVADNIEATIESSKIKQIEMKLQHQEEQVAKQQEIINQLVVYSMAFFLFAMLNDFYKIEKGLLDEYIFHNNDHFRSNLRWLRDHGYLEMTFKVGSLVDGQNIAPLVKLTPVGRFYVELRRKYEANASVAS